MEKPPLHVTSELSRGLESEELLHKRFANMLDLSPDPSSHIHREQPRGPASCRSVLALLAE